eukprot:CAMPEP_0183745058 /NCGR_PEP_ID=MMETSP0737-20130205/66046_1 /TAXON_ID=385413 /ORGANISM="Thalassiosira miniscula, Strain CCMP1093" /LENGTH=701 /DNA_ID=CAMNT_0025980715 /DNA_START=633 /DNA_END=2737 /DNA_ORIENTATION=-
MGNINGSNMTPPPQYASGSTPTPPQQYVSGSTPTPPPQYVSGSNPTSPSQYMPLMANIDPTQATSHTPTPPPQCMPVMANMNGQQAIISNTSSPSPQYLPEMGNVSGPQGSSPQYMPAVPAQYQQDSTYHVPSVSSQSSHMQQQQRDGTNQGSYMSNQQQQQQQLSSEQYYRGIAQGQGNFSNQQNQQTDNKSEYGSFNFQNQAQQYQPQQYPNQQGAIGGIAQGQGNFSNQQNQQTDNKSEYGSFNFQNQAQQYQPQQYPNQQGAPYNQQNNGQQNQIGQNKQKMLSPQQVKHPSLETLDKSLFSSSSNAESWLKASSIGSADLFTNSSLSNSMAFHSVGNMSASFNSTMGTSGLDSPRNSTNSTENKANSNDVPGAVVVGSEGVGGRSSTSEDAKGVATDSHKSGGERSSGVTAGDQSGRGNDREVSNASSNKGPTYTEANVPLQPIQEHEADDSSLVGDEMLLGKSSLMLSMVEGDFADSAMSIDSQTLNAMMKQSGGEDVKLSLSDFADSTGKTEEASPKKSPPSSGGAPAKLGNQNDTNSSGSQRSMSGNSSSMHSSVSMEDNETKEAPISRKETLGSAHSARSSRSLRGNRSMKVSMMSEVSQWTMSNPFDNNNSSADSPNVEDKASKKKEQRKGDTYAQKDCPVDMGDFHSLGGSIESLNLSMMSSMSGGGEELSQSLRALDISGRLSDQRKGR